MARIGGRGWSGLAAILAVLVAMAAPAARAAAALEAKPPATALAKLQDVQRLLADPEVQALLGRPVAQEAPAPAPPAGDLMMASTFADRLQRIRQHLLELLGAGRTLPADVTAVETMLGRALDGRGAASAAGLFLAFVGLGFGVERLFRTLLSPLMRWLLALTLDTVRERVRAVFARFAFGLGMIVSFAVGSVGAFVLFDWPVVLKEVLLGYLFAFLLARLAAVLARLLLAPGAERFRVVPLSTGAATFLFHRAIVLAVLLGFGAQTISLFNRFGLSPAAGEIARDALGLLVLATLVEAIWRIPHLRLEPDDAAPTPFAARHRTSLAFAASAVLVLLWLLMAADATRLFWLGAFALAVPLTMVVARRAVNHILRPAGLKVSADEVQTLDAVVFERGVRAVILAGAALLLARILDIDLVSLTMDDTAATRVVRGAVSVLIIALAADFLWRVLRAVIDRKIAGSLLLVHGQEATDAGHAARLQTLLPIVSNILFVVIVVVTGMMMLAAVGVEIGPLIASAGVVGVAIGFGAQTLVKDIIAGIFYLFDDAFRVGEYIQSGTFKGTVESFSLRSVKLRHQRGALYTVPFGILGAVQNQSRDWVVDKIVLNLPYGTDLERVRKIIKKIGEALQDDEEIGPAILNPLKMQGVVQFGDFAIQIQTKMMTRPGDAQFLGRRRALLLINQAFTENGIGFAVPMVHVAGQGGNGDGAALAAAAGKGLDLVRAVKPA